MSTKVFGGMLKRLRIQRGETLREHCLNHGFDPGNYSRLERGLYPPPRNEELLAKYATALDLQYGTDEWLEFFDLAAACRGELPRDFQDEELVEKLPVLFRTLRGDQVDPSKLDRLVEMIRKQSRGDRA